MRLYCSCLNVSVLVQDKAVQCQLPPTEAPSRALFESLSRECHWPSSSLACVRLSQRFPDCVCSARPELCHQRQVAETHCTLVECVNCHTIVLAFPQGSEPLVGALRYPDTAFVHPSLFCPSQDIEAMGVDVLQSFLKSEKGFLPPEQMDFSPAFRIYVHPPPAMLNQASFPSNSSMQAFSTLQQHVQTYLEHEEHLMSDRIAAFIEEQEKLFEEQRIRALRDRDALLLVLRQHEEVQEKQQKSEKSEEDSILAKDTSGAALPRPDEVEQSPMFSFQEDDEQQKESHTSPQRREEEPVRSAEETGEGGEEELSGAVKQAPLWDSTTVLLPDPDRTLKVPVAPRTQRLQGRVIVIQPRHASPVPLLQLTHSGGVEDDGGNSSCGGAASDAALNMVYSSSMPIQVPLLADDTLDLRKRAKKAFVKQAYGKKVVAKATGAVNDGSDVPDPPLSQSFAVPSSLNIRNPFRPE